MSIAARAIHHLLRSTSACTGEDFFGALVRSMAEALDTRHAFLGELTADGRVEVRALWTREHAAPGDDATAEGAYGEPFSYALAGTPCAEVIATACCDYPRDVQALFPGDDLLVEMGIHAYFGVPVRGAHGVTRGLLVALDDRPRESLPELESILGMFAARAAAELERLDAERELRASEERYRMIVSTCAEGVWTIDAAGSTTYVNPQMSRMLGYAPEEMLGRSVLDFMDEPSRRRTLDNIERRRAGIRERHDFELRHRDGHAVQTWMATSPITDAAGAYAGALAMVSDVTDQHALEARVREAERLEGLGLLAGGIAHDFNNLLVGVLGQSELGLRTTTPGEPLHDLLLGVREAAERAADLTRQLLAYAGKSVESPWPVSLHRTVTEIAGLVRASTPARVAISLDLDPAPILVVSTPGALTQVVLNLVTNAVQALGDRGGTVVVSTRKIVLGAEPVVSASGQTLSPGAYVVLAVEDDGRGMDAATCARVFEPFFTTKRAGTGLGLAAVHGIVRSCGGAIHVDSAPGRGSTFTVHLPVSTSAQEIAAAPAPAPAAAAGLRGRILLADDEASVRQVVQRSLEHLGFEVEAVADGRAAIERFAAAPTRYAVVLMDVTMPGLGGVDAALQIHDLAPDVPVVLMSGFSTDSIPANLRHVTFLPKPFRVDTLAEALTRALS
jgi:two-component system cell cycle sensor histidine kinase/response regulator CckA